MYKETGKILISYSPNGIFPLDTNSEIFLDNFLQYGKRISLIRSVGFYNDDEWEFYPYGNYIWEGTIEKKEKTLAINGEYTPTDLFSLSDGIDKSILVDGFHKCSLCDNKAQYLYMGSTYDFQYKDYLCENCICYDEEDYFYSENGYEE